MATMVQLSTEQEALLNRLLLHRKRLRLAYKPSEEDMSEAGRVLREKGALEANAFLQERRNSATKKATKVSIVTEAIGLGLESLRCTYELP